VATAIAIESIVKSFGAGSPPAVGGVSLSVGPGELFFLLGPSGCGKTTLLRMIAGFTEPTSGKILFTGAAGTKRDVTFLPPNQRNTGMVFQSYALWPHMTVAANVAFGLQIRRVGKAEMGERVREALDLVRMGQYADRKPNQLSGGQQQRVALARALVVRPDVLLLDEPLSNLDAKLRIELRSEIRRICKTARTDDGGQGITTVYVTHDQKEALSMADQVAIMSGGKVVQLGPPAELYRAPGSRFVAEFLGETNFIPGRAAAGAGETIVETAAGTLRSSRRLPTAPGGTAPVEEVACSIRPETVRIGAAGPKENALTGKVVETTYLGELAQHVVEVVAAGGTLAGSGGGGGAAPVRLRVAVLNPGPTAVGRELPLAIAQDDVVLVPA
jgi:iron(III) transport system ATP-binding protein